MKYTASIVASTALWFIFPLMLELTSGTKTEYGWHRFWSGFPKFTLYWYAMFIPVAIVMHLLFARITIKLKGWKFWSFPMVSLSVAGFLVWVMLSFATGIEKGKIFDWSADWIYGVLYVYAVVFVSMVWLSYPLAILNQIIIRKLLAEPDGAINSEAAASPR